MQRITKKKNGQRPCMKLQKTASVSKIGQMLLDIVPEEGSAVPKGESGGKGIGYLSGEKGEAEQMVLETVREACRMRLDDLMVQKQIYNKEKTSV